MPTLGASEPSDLSPLTVASIASRSGRLKTRKSTSESASGSRGTRSQRTSDASTSKSAVAKRPDDCRRLFSSTVSPRRLGRAPPLPRRRHLKGNKQQRGEDNYQQVFVAQPPLPPRHSRGALPIDNQIEVKVEADRQGDLLQEGEDLKLAAKLEHFCPPSNSKVQIYLLRTAVGSKHLRRWN